MAEAFAKRYGGDVLSVQSAGLLPASIIVPPTIEAMREKNIELEGHFPKSFEIFNPRQFDLIINMSGMSLPPGLQARVEKWTIKDPVHLPPAEFRAVRDEIENRVMRLILEQRMKEKQANGR